MKFTPSILKRLLNLYPPYLGAGVRVTYIGEDWRELHVSMKLHWFNRNAVGTHFGGSLYLMVDPHVMLLLIYRGIMTEIYWKEHCLLLFIRDLHKFVHYQKTRAQGLILDGMVH